MQIRECEVVPNWDERLVDEVKVVQIVPNLRFLYVNNWETVNAVSEQHWVCSHTWFVSPPTWNCETYKSLQNQQLRRYKKQVANPIDQH